VEDNPVNRKVALELLGRRSHKVEVATNGQEAVDATAAQSFDVVLMDVHMPVMDGLTATRTIREREHGSGRHVPIIALTAGATAEDRENCLAAGMTGFITKPFRAEQLFRAVEAVPADAFKDSVREEGAPSAPASEEAPCLDWEGALSKLEGDEDFLRELAEMFLAQYPDLLGAVEEAIASEEGDALRRAAHALKGSAQVIGGKAAAETALQLENLGRAADWPEAMMTLDTLRADLAALKAALLAKLPEHETL
jgi:CheY-like chemotaxis protein